MDQSSNWFKIKYNMSQVTNNLIDFSIINHSYKISLEIDFKQDFVLDELELN